GNFVWARGTDGPAADGSGLAVDLAGNVYTTGDFGGTVDFDPGPATFNLTAGVQGRGIFVAKLDGTGNFTWARSRGGLGGDAGLALAVFGAGNVYVTGYFGWDVYDEGAPGLIADFDPGPGTFQLTSAGYPDIFVMKLQDPPSQEIQSLIGQVTALGDSSLL